MVWHCYRASLTISCTFSPKFPFRGLRKANTPVIQEFFWAALDPKDDADLPSFVMNRHNYNPDPLILPILHSSLTPSAWSTCNLLNNHFYIFFFTHLRSYVLGDHIAKMSEKTSIYRQKHTNTRPNVDFCASGFPFTSCLA